MGLIWHIRLFCYDMARYIKPQVYHELRFKWNKGDKHAFSCLKSDQVEFSKTKKVWYVNESPSSKNNNSITLISPQKASWWMRALTGKLKLTNNIFRAKKIFKITDNWNTVFFYNQPDPHPFHPKLKANSIWYMKFLGFYIKAITEITIFQDSLKVQTLSFISNFL